MKAVLLTSLLALFLGVASLGFVSGAVVGHAAQPVRANIAFDVDLDRGDASVLAYDVDLDHGAPSAHAA